MMSVLLQCFCKITQTLACPSQGGFGIPASDWLKGTSKFRININRSLSSTPCISGSVSATSQLPWISQFFESLIDRIPQNAGGAMNSQQRVPQPKADDSFP
jgi:hypothetical protein